MSPSFEIYFRNHKKSEQTNYKRVIYHLAMSDLIDKSTLQKPVYDK